MPDRALSYWGKEQGITPDTARDPWSFGGGGAVSVSTSRGAHLLATGIGQWRRQATASDALPRRPADRIELQVSFQGATFTVGDWPAGVSPFCLWIDDGDRKLGLSVGDQLAIVNPDTGETLAEFARQPGGWTTGRTYLLAKVDTDRWEILVDGAIVATLPYLAGAACGTEQISGGALVAGGRRRAACGFGFNDPAGSGEGWFGLAEHGLNEVLAPEWAVQRVRNAMDAYLQARWSTRTLAMVRALVGVWQVGMVRTRLAPDLFTAGKAPVEIYSFKGDVDPTDLGWTSTAGLEIVSGRVRLPASSAAQRISRAMADPSSADTIRWIRTTVRVADYTSEDTRGRVGPYLQILDGAHTIGAQMLFDRANPGRVGWRLTDSEPGAGLGHLGAEVGPVDWARDRVVELYVVGTERAILVVDDLWIEDADYSVFTAASATFEMRLGRDGMAAPILRCDAEYSDTEVGTAYADPRQRALFVQRLAERCQFASGAETNQWLWAYSSHRDATFQRRGTEGTIYEVRRVANDPDAKLSKVSTPAGWFLEVTYPETSPVFLDADGYLDSVTCEYRALAPLIEAAALGKLITKFFLPFSLVESPIRAALVTDLTGPASSTVAPVESARGFAVGEIVDWLHDGAGDVLTVGYDSDYGLGAALVGYRDYGALSADATAHNAADGLVARIASRDDRIPYDPVLTQINVGVSYASARSASIALAGLFADGFVVAGWFTASIAHDATRWVAFATSHGIGVGGLLFERIAAAGALQVTVYDGAAAKQTVAFAFAPAVGQWVWLAARLDVPGNSLSVWRNGVQVATIALGGLTPIYPVSTLVGLGSDEANANKWKGDNRDLSLFGRPLTDPEMQALYADDAGHDPLRTDAALALWYLPPTRSVQEATIAGDLLAADHAQVATDTGEAWGVWFATSQGGQGLRGELNGTVTTTGLLGERSGIIVAGNVVRLTSASAGEDVWIEVYGVTQAGPWGLERLHVVGTTPIVGVTTWAEVHGGLGDQPVAANLTIKDHGAGTTLYTIGTGTIARGVKVFDPPLLCGPQVAGATPGAVASVDVGIIGHVEGAGYGVQGVTLTSTDRIETAAAVTSIRALALGFLAGATSLAVDAAIVDRSVGLRAVSSDPGDNGLLLRVYGISAVFVLTYEDVEIGGADGVQLWTKILGAELLGLGVVATGTITVTQSGGAGPITTATIAPGGQSIAFDRRLIGNAGAPTVVVSDEPASPRIVLLVGLDDAGAVVLRTATLTSLPHAVDGDIATLTGIGVGDLPFDTWVVTRGVGWRGRDYARTLEAIAACALWSATNTREVTDIDVGLDDAGYVNVCDAAQDLTGTWSVAELATVTATDIAGHTIETTAVAGSYGVGDRIREGINS